MIVSLILAGALIVVGTILYLHHRFTGSTREPAESDPSADPTPNTNSTDICCGLHAICERDLPKTGTIEYFDDEELDIYSGRRSNEYTPPEIEQFREILLSLIPTDIVPWSQSLEQRNIQLPQEIRDEMILLLSELATPTGSYA